MAYSYQMKEQFSTTLNTESPIEQSTFNDFQFVLRHNIIKQNGLITVIGMQFTTRFGGLGNYQGYRFSYEGKLILQHRLSENLLLNSNFSLEHNDEIDYTFGRYVFSFGYTLSDRLSIVAEAYGNADDKAIELFFDGGFGYLLSNNLQLDIYGGYGQNTIEKSDITTTSYFVSVGFSYRINTRD